MKTKIGLITGGSRGLGKDMALRLAEKGNDVIITYNTKKEKAESVVAEIKAKGRKAGALQFNASDIKGIDNFITNLKSVLKNTFDTEKFDFLVNNAGIGATIPFAEVTEEDFDLFMNVHFKSVYFLTQKCLPVMNDGGRVINISSGTTRFSNPGYSVYATMKSAVETFTRYLAKEVGPRSITANIVAPGGIETDFNNAAIRNNPQIKSMIAANTALGRVGVAEDIGGIVAFLCSDDARWINGQRIEASGGVFL